MKASPTSPNAPRRLRSIFLALGLSFLLAFVVGEALVRVFLEAPLAEREPLLEVRANEFRGFEMVPGVHYTYHHPVHVNSLGLRGPEIDEKRPGETRILTLGDSLLYGQGVGDDETLAHYMRELLGGGYTVINGGHRAYATHQELGMLRELGPRLKPDVAVVFWYWNDLIERDIQKTHTNLTASGPIAFDVGKRMEGSTRLKWHLRQYVRRSALVMYVYDQYQARRRRGKASDKGFITAGLKRMRGYTKSLREEAATLGCQLVFAIIPDPATLDAEHFSTGIVDAAKTILEDAGVPTLDLSAPVKALYNERGSLPVIPYDYHYLPDGNRVMAQAVVQWLVELRGQ